MRRILIAILCWLSVSAFADIDCGGTLCPVDTLEHYQAGPGTWYTRMDIHMTSSRTVRLYMMEVDLTDPYATLEVRNGGGSVGQNEQMTQAHLLLDSAEHRPIGAVNCNFFWQPHPTAEGLQWQPTGGTAHDGILITNPDDWTMGATQIADPRWRDMGYMAIDFGKRVWMEQLLWDGRMTLADGSSYPLRDCNRYRTNPYDDEIALFNEGLGQHPTRVLDQGTELLFSVDEWRINRPVRCTVVSQNSTGGTLIGHNQGVLQVRGTGWSFISGLAQGDTFQIDLGIYAPHIDNARPDIREMAMGNALCMVDSELICRNWNEAYNTQVYARTGIATNTAGNRFWMLVMETPGMSTEEMCHVFRASGASYAAGCDGGGSAEMEIGGEAMNKTTEATPRAVNTMIFAMSSAPDDLAVADIRLRDRISTAIPAFSHITPAFRAYNQYGTLLSDDYADCTLTCSPASLGSISADGRTFTALTAGSGTLTATTPAGVSTSFAVSVTPAELRIRLDSAIADLTPYSIEVEAVQGEKVFPVDPQHIEWHSNDEAIARVSADGLLTGVAAAEQSTRRTLIIGSLGDWQDSLMAVAEVPLAAEQHLGCALDTTVSFTSVRGPKLTIDTEMRLFGRPDSIRLCLESEAGINFITCFFATPAVEDSKVKKTPKQGICTVLPSEIADADDMGNWPVTLRRLTLTLENIQANTPYRIRLTDITCYYGHCAAPSALPAAEAASTSHKRLIDGQVVIIRQGRTYDSLGRSVE